MVPNAKEKVLETLLGRNCMDASVQVRNAEYHGYRMRCGTALSRTLFLVLLQQETDQVTDLG